MEDSGCARMTAEEAVPGEAAPAKKKARKPSSRQQMAQGEPVCGSVVLCEDGCYRWIYALSLYKNPTIFLLVWKIFFFILMAILGVVILHDLIAWGPDRLGYDLRFLAYFLIGMTALVFLGYVLYAAVMGGSYTVLFEMDEQGLNHRQVVAQAKKARALGKLTALAGAASGSVSAMAAGFNAQRTELYSDFSRVRRVRACPHRQLIKLDAPLNHNQVYAAAEDFDFVLSYILSHCPNLKGRANR